jgi:hypothetical protein
MVVPREVLEKLILCVFVRDPGASSKIRDTGPLGFILLNTA